jgi:hypothetical protein
MCLLAARSAAACKRTRAVARVSGTATGADVGVAAGSDELGERAATRGWCLLSLAKEQRGDRAAHGCFRAHAGHSWTSAIATIQRSDGAGAS